MKTRQIKGWSLLSLFLLMNFSLAACGGAGGGTDVTAVQTTDAAGTAVMTSITGLTNLIDTADQFTERDLTQTPDLTDAQNITLKDGEDVAITEEGVYVVSGSAKDATIVVEAEDTAKVQLVLDGLNIANSDSPAIYVKSADKTYITTAEGSDNNLTVSGSFTADGDTNTDAVIFAKDDLVLNGLGNLTIDSSNNGITGKDDLKITGGTYTIKAQEDAVEAHNSVRIADGTFTLEAGKDAIHAEDSDDNSVGYVYIAGGTFNVTAGDDGVQATTYAIVDGGTLKIESAEGIEGTYVQINEGDITIAASDDGINAAQKSTAVDTNMEINGGKVAIDMAQGDTDALDSNGNLKITGGTVAITAQFAFDFDGTGELTGGTVTVNGEQVTEITNSMMGGGGRSGMPGQP